MNKYLLTILFVLNTVFLFSQNEGNDQLYIEDFVEVDGVYYTDQARIKTIKEFEKARDYLQQSKPDAAIPLLLDILDDLDIRDNLRDIVRISIAEGYRQKREYEKGLDILYSVLESEKLSHYNQTYAYTRIAAIYNEGPFNDFPKYDSVELYSNLSIENSLKYDFPDMLATSQNEIGYVCIIKKQYSEAIAYLEAALEGFLSTGMNRHAIAVSVNLSNANLYSDNLYEAEQIIDTAFNYLDEEGNENLIMRLYLQKAKVFEHQEDYKNAYENLSKGRLLQKKFFIDRLDTEVFEMSAKYDLKIKESKIREEELKSEKKQRVLYIWMIVVVVLILIILGGAYIFSLQRKNFRQKQKINTMNHEMLIKDIDLKNRELTNVIAGGIATEKLLLKVKEHIQEEKYNGALQLINTGLATDKKWNTFMLNFNKFHPDYLLKLQKAHPKLTDNEKRLAVLLRSGLKTKEMAAMLNVEVSAINKGRQRLRKKLRLNPEVDLKEYFLSL